MSINKEIILIRHGQTNYNLESRVQGLKINADINHNGQKQAEAFYNAYKDFGFEYIVVSALKRTKQTVGRFIENFNLPFEERPELNEISWGIHEGEKSSSEKRVLYDQVVSDWKNGVYSAKIPEGQSAFDMKVQQLPLLEYFEQLPYSKILVCSHGRAMRSLMCLMLELPLSQMDKFPHENTSVNHFRLQNGKFEILKQNDTTHLNGVTY